MKNIRKQKRKEGGRAGEGAGEEKIAQKSQNIQGQITVPPATLEIKN